MSIKKAFLKDGFTVVAEKTISSGSTGYLAESITAFNHGTNLKKTALYVEGSAYDMGYLTGLLAEPQVSQMSGKFANTILVDFIDPNLPEWLTVIVGTILKNIVQKYSVVVEPTIPDVYKEEMQGIVDGCMAVNPNSRVTYDDLWVLNVGFDVVCAWAYAPLSYWEAELAEMKQDNLLFEEFEFDRQYLQMPIMCNGFSVFKDGTVDGTHYMGRDFQFPTAEVFQNVATMIVYKPNDGRIPLVSTTAPGIVGSMVSMNTYGVAAGVDMAPAGNNNPKQPGFNSLLLLRHAVHEGDSAESAAQTMIDAERGASWIYPIGDGTNDRAVIAEAGMTTDELDPLSYPPDIIASLLPSQEFLDTHDPDTSQKGIILRWNDYQYPVEFIAFNEGLFNFFGKPYSDDYWGPLGFIDQSFRDKNCPQFYFFCPQREEKDHLLLVTNQFTSPRMRLVQMAPWSSLISVKYWDDVPWRYDALNYILQTEFGTIDAEGAWKAINFLSPTIGKYPDYYVYKKSPVIKYRGRDGKWHTTIEVHGSTTLMDLTAKKMMSLYGYYADEPIEISLLNYV